MSAPRAARTGQGGTGAVPPASAAPVPPAGARPSLPAVPPGPRRESALLAFKLATDLLSIPLHVLVLLFTRGRQRRRLRDALRASGRGRAP